VIVDHVARLPQAVSAVAADGVVASHGLLVADSVGPAEVSTERWFTGREAAWHAARTPYILCERFEPRKCAS
jgi:hypothetical protein